MAEQKKTLSAKQVVADIRAGSTDEFLMKKYGVSEKGLQSLFQKLITAKVLTQADLDRRKSAVEEVEAVIAEDEAKPTPSTPTSTQKTLVSAKALVNDIQAGMNDDALMQKYELSDENLQKLLKQLLDKGLIEESDLSRRPAVFAAAPPPPPAPSDADEPPAQIEAGAWYQNKNTLILLIIFCPFIGVYGLLRTSV